MTSLFCAPVLTAMGQYWKIFNLDKRQRYWTSGGAKLGEFLCGSPFPILFWLIATKPKDPQNPFHPVLDEYGPWAGDRIICCGDYIRDYPEGMLTEDELQEFRQGRDGEHNLYGVGVNNYEVVNISSMPNTTYVPGYPWVLRNLSKREYVHSEAIEVTEDAGADQRYIESPGLAEALLCRICWSSDPSTAMRYEPLWPGNRPLHRGVWAGDRFDIITSRDFDTKHEGWKDVSNAFRREVFDIWASECGDDVVDPWKTRGCQAPKSVDPPFPECTLEIKRYIMEAAAREEIMDALSLARVSKVVNTWMTPIIYHSIILKEVRKLKSLCDTLKMKPELGSNIHRLFCNQEVEPGVFKAALQCCTKLEYLVTNINIDTMVPREDVSSIESPWAVLQHVMAMPDSEILPKKDHPLLHNITHLHIDFKELRTLATLLPDSLPHLTHLALFCSLQVSWRLRHSKISYRKEIEDILQSNPSFKVVLLIPYDDDVPQVPLAGDRCAELTLIKDERLLARRGLDFDDYENIMKHGGNLFANAEEEYRSWRDTIPPLSPSPA